MFSPFSLAQHQYEQQQALRLQQQQQHLQQQRNANQDYLLPRNFPSSSSSSPALPLSAQSSQPSSFGLSLPVAPSVPQFSSLSEENKYVASLLSHARELVSHGKPMAALDFVLQAARQQGGEKRVFQVLNQTRIQHGLQPHANPYEQELIQNDFDTEEEKELRDTAELLALTHINPNYASSSMTLPTSQNNSPSRYFQSNSNIPQSFSSPGPFRSRYSNSEFDDEQMQIQTFDMSDEKKGHVETNNTNYQNDIISPSESILVAAGRGNLLAEAFDDERNNQVCPYCQGLIAKRRYRTHVEEWCEAVER